MRKKGFEEIGELVDFALKHPDLAPDRVAIIEISEERLSQIMTRSRRELIRKIREENPNLI